MTALRAKLYREEPPKEEFSLLDYVRNKILDRDTGARNPGYFADYVPLPIFRNVRALNVGSDPAGGYLVGTETRLQDFVAALGPVLLANRLGVPTMPGLIENVMIPLGMAGALGYWLGEGSPPPESDPTFGVATLRPHTVGALLPPVSRNLIMSAPKETVEPILQGLLALATGSAIDAALFAGTGVDGEPMGILSTSGIDSRSGAAFSLATATAMLKVLEDAHVPTENAAWVMGPAAAQTLRNREKVSGQPVYLLGDDNKMSGRPAYVSASIPAGKVLLGHFAEGAAIASWGPGMELLINDKTKSTQGLVLFNSFASIDIFVRRPEAFAIATGVN